MDCIVVVEKGKTEKEEVKLVANDSEVAQGSITVLADVVKVAMGLDLNPVFIH